MDYKIERTVFRWRDGAIEELNVARALLAAGHLRQCLFWLHLSLEKALKAHVVKSTQKQAPYTHSLPRLFELAGLTLRPEWASAVDELNAYQAQSRYDDMNSDEILSIETTYASSMMKTSEEIVEWLIRIL